MIKRLLHCFAVCLLLSCGSHQTDPDWNNMPVSIEPSVEVSLTKKKSRKSKCSVLSYYCVGEPQHQFKYYGVKVKLLNRNKENNEILVSENEHMISFLDGALYGDTDTNFVSGYYENYFKGTDTEYHKTNGVLLEFQKRYDTVKDRYDTLWLKYYPDDFCYRIYFSLITE
jgi:hypothetical protein